MHGTTPEPSNAEQTLTHRPALAHVMEPRTLILVFTALVTLTVVTVLVASFESGSWEIWISLGIATVKAILVLLYFMHLRYDSGFNSIVFICSLLFVFLFLSFTLMDAQQYAPLLRD
jgi:cytochrome c oxidase subunit 4